MLVGLDLESTVCCMVGVRKRWDRPELSFRTCWRCAVLLDQDWIVDNFFLVIYVIHWKGFFPFIPTLPLVKIVFPLFFFPGPPLPEQQHKKNKTPKPSPRQRRTQGRKTLAREKTGKGILFGLTPSDSSISRGGKSSAGSGTGGRTNPDQTSPLFLF